MGSHPVHLRMRPGLCGDAVWSKVDQVVGFSGGIRPKRFQWMYSTKEGHDLGLDQK